MNHAAVPAMIASCAQWRKSSYSQGENTCVEITTEIAGWVGVRDSKAGPSQDMLAFGGDQWRALLTSVRTHRPLA